MGCYTVVSHSNLLVSGLLYSSVCTRVQLLLFFFQLVVGGTEFNQLCLCQALAQSLLRHACNAHLLVFLPSVSTPTRIIHVLRLVNEESHGNLKARLLQGLPHSGFCCISFCIIHLQTLKLGRLDSQRISYLTGHYASTTNSCSLASKPETPINLRDIHPTSRAYKHFHVISWLTLFERRYFHVCDGDVETQDVRVLSGPGCVWRSW